MDSHHRPFSGALTAIVSPFLSDADDHTLDLASFKRVIASQKRGGMSGIVVAGTTGESPTLTPDEKLQLLEAALAEQDDSFSVYVGTGTNATASTVAEIAKCAAFRSRGQGVRGIMVVAPYYNRPNQAGLAWHFGRAARAAGSTPVCLYNVPARTGSCLLPATFAELAEAHNNIVAIKEAAGDVLVLTQLRLALRARNVARPLTLLSGDDATYPAALVAGAQGVISVTSHVIPRVISSLLSAAQAGDLERVRTLHLAAFPLAQGLFCAPNPAPVKFALSLHDLCQAHVRSPLVALSRGEQDTVRAALALAQELGATVLS